MDARLRAGRGVPARGAGHGRGRLHARDRPAAGGGEEAEALGHAPAAGSGRAGLRAGEARPDARDRGATMWGPIVFGNQAPDSGNSEILAEFGTEAQKTRWLHPLLDGKIRSAFSMTEPNTAGSDPTLLSTTAVLDGDEWVINGHK